MRESVNFSRNQISHTEGWILDLYPKNENMIVWLKTRNDQVVRLVDNWRQCLFVAGDYSNLTKLPDRLRIEGMSFEEKYVKSEDNEPSTVLKIPVRNSCEAERLAEKILVYGRYRQYELYNVDVKASQLYMYEKNIYPFEYVKVTANQNHIHWDPRDNLESVDYEIPPLREIGLSATIQRERRLPDQTDPIEMITITSEGETYYSNGCNEREKLLWLVETLKTFDPDIIYTNNGDKFLFPYLAYRATLNGITNHLILGRESIPFRASYERGQTYMSYGKICYRPMPTRLLGRLHIDRENSILCKDCGLQGIIEVARLCRIPAQRATSTTIGTSMTSAQFYEAGRQDVLIPWQKTNTEELKTANELRLADRGGFYYEPEAGLHESVGEIDFTSLYPMIMFRKNLSGETVLCECCVDSKNRVPELGYNVCMKRIGIVSKSLKLLLEKRQRYKELRQHATDHKLRAIYEMRQAALKWILVCSFGYLGFKNARFGKIDAHIATCAHARRILKETVRLAESRGFRLIHGIVDSVWLKKEGAEETDYLRLCAEIEKTTGFTVTFEGIYRWIVFLPSKTCQGVPTLNRYYGVFRNGKIKDRGIATRRRDTPPIINRCIREIIHVLAKAENAEEFYARLPSVCEVIKRYIHRIRSGDVSSEELAIQKHISQTLSEYRHNVLQAIAADQLTKEGGTINAGESIGYVITNSQSRIPSKRALALELCENNRAYDKEAYVDLLRSAVDIMFMPPLDKMNPSKQTTLPDSNTM